MRFASSRLLTASVLTGAFVLHSACGGAVDLNFVGVSGGGTSAGKGGASSGKGGASSGKGGANTAGDGSDGGSGNSSNAGANQDGGSGGEGGGGNVAGTGGEGGGGNVVGTGGEGGGTNNCQPSQEICDDGIDNDCDDLLDCPVLISAFPENRKAASGADVELTFEPPADGEFQCRYGKPAEIDNKLWFDCPGPVVTPVTDADSLDPAQDGLKLFQVRLKYTDTFSEVVEWTAYTHHSLHGELHCPSQATDQAYFTFAATLLSQAGTFGAEAKLDNPFINITFDPPVDTYINVSDTDGLVKPLSLRKRFVTDPTNQYLLMSRVYESKAYQTNCQALAVIMHDNNGAGPLNIKVKPTCTALVFNKKGAGVCLRASAGTITLGYPNNTSYFVPPLYDGDVDNLLWRELKRLNNSNGRTRYFSPKCSGDPTCVDTVPGSTFAVYLPDIELFN